MPASDRPLQRARPSQYFLPEKINSGEVLTRTRPPIRVRTLGLLLGGIRGRAGGRGIRGRAGGVPSNSVPGRWRTRLKLTLKSSDFDLVLLSANVI